MARRKERKRRPDRLGRIERKCDRILSELITLRQRIGRGRELDTLIDRMHESARRMRMQAEHERELVSLLLREGE